MQQSEGDLTVRVSNVKLYRKVNAAAGTLVLATLLGVSSFAAAQGIGAGVAGGVGVGVGASAGGGAAAAAAGNVAGSAGTSGSHGPSATGIAASGNVAGGATTTGSGLSTAAAASSHGMATAQENAADESAVDAVAQALADGDVSAVAHREEQNDLQLDLKPQ